MSPRILQRTCASTWRAIAAATLLAAAFALPSQAGEAASGKDWLVEKNSETQTLRLEDVSVRVTDDTWIYNGDEKRMSFAQIPEPGPHPVSVVYTGSLSGDTVIADRMTVEQVPR